MADVLSAALSAALPGAHRLQDISCEPPSAEGEVVGRNGELRRIHSPQGTAGVAAKNRPTDPLPTHGICFVADTPALALPSILARTCTRKLSDTCHARTSAARAPHRAQRYVTGKAFAMVHRYSRPPTRCPGTLRAATRWEHPRRRWRGGARILDSQIDRAELGRRELPFYSTPPPLLPTGSRGTACPSGTQ